MTVDDAVGYKALPKIEVIINQEHITHEQIRTYTMNVQR